MKKEEKLIWDDIRHYAEQQVQKEPFLASLMHMNILSRNGLAESLVFIITERLKTPMVLQDNLVREFHQVLDKHPEIMDDVIRDLQAVKERDPACESYAQALLNFKGFQAVQTHRIAHELWKSDRKAFAGFLQNRVSEVFGVDTHPGAQIGHGFMMDHATGVVIGETAIIGNNVSMLHGVTLGGTGTETTKKRHPTIGDGVLLGAGCKVLGDILVGDNAKVAASSVVLKEVDENVTVAGIPAKPVGRVSGPEPSRRMDHGNLNSQFDDVSSESVVHVLERA